MGVEGFPNVTEGGKRTAKRARVLLAAKLRTATGEVDARLRDLSQKGALIECNQRLAIDDQVTFVRGDTVVPARVAWSGGNRFGLEFLRMIDESEVLVHVARPTVTQNQQRFRRPRIMGEDLSEQDRKLAQVFAKSVGISIRD